ncbi:MAG: arginyl-tRNA synthetase, partial [Actinomycetota bacterium]|nr:arginyl-tRNA synthetase [Actinomycetota bacterium]
MDPPVVVLTRRLQSAIETVLGEDHRGADPVLRRSTSPQFGDYQANAAMALAKKVGWQPRALAQSIVDALDVLDVCSKVEVAGPGFINLTLRDEALADAARALVEDDRLAVPEATAVQTYVIDYSHPNVAKEMHVGHLRSTIIGDAIVRVVEFLGHRVVRHNHIGDWGTPFGMLIEHLVDLGEEATAEELSVGDLDAFYKGARIKFDTDEAFAARARRRVVTLQSGDEETLRLWRVLVAESTRYFDAVYERLGVTLTDDDIVGESFYNPWLDDVAAELESRGLARIDDGALCAFPSGFKGRDGEPLPLIVRKRDGGYGYQATDLAAIRYRVDDVGADHVLYVVDAGQSQHHLPMVIAVAQEAGWLGDAEAHLVPFGLVLGDDGKRFKSRTGESVKLSDLLDEAVDRAMGVVGERSELDADEQADVARAVGIGAIKYADLSNDRIKDYTFDFDRMLAFDGNTGPYLQYALARVRSIFRRAEASEGEGGGAIAVTEDAERELTLALLGFGEVVESVVDSFQPHRLTTYLFDLAQT